jgi:predicted dehydrogenase
MINWGIIGLGNIANTFAKDLLLSNTGKLYAVASRNLEKAKEFSKQHNAIVYYDTYEALANDPNIDVIYIATPHALHFEHTMLCFNKRKAVLCEKPMGIASSQVETMIKEAKSKNVFFMEGLWTRFIPATEKLLELIKQNVIGDIISIQADFGFKADIDFEGRLYNKKLGGGALLDIGIYPIYLSLLLLGAPKDIKVMARMTETDVDSYCAMLFSYENKAIANLECTIEANTPTEAIIYGSNGHIKLHKEFFSTKQLTVEKNGIETTIDLDITGTGYFHEIEEVNHCIINNLKESSKVPLNTSLELITIIDRIKTLIGLRYDI